MHHRHLIQVAGQTVAILRSASEAETLAAMLRAAPYPGAGGVEIVHKAMPTIPVPHPCFRGESVLA